MSAARDEASGTYRFTHDAMACTFALQLVASDPNYARQAAAAAFAELDQLEQVLSRFIPHSDIGQLNVQPPGEFLRISHHTRTCLELAARLYADTGGALNIAYRSQRPADTPPEQPPLIFDPRIHAVARTDAGVTLDLGGIGKGYALDHLVTVLRAWNIGAALLQAGQSTAYAFGAPPDATHWTVGLRAPYDQPPPRASLPLVDAAFSGSGQWLHGAHILDPRGGGAIPANRAAWAGAPTAAEADALSTAFMIMDVAAIQGLCARRPELWAILRRGGPADDVFVNGALFPASP